MFVAAYTAVPVLAEPLAIPDPVSPASPGEALSYDEQPALAVGKDGRAWLAWVGWRREGNSEGDRIYVARRGADGWDAPRAVTPTVGNYLRPSLAVLDGTPYVFWTATTEVPTSIWMSCWNGKAWSAPARVSPPGGVHQRAVACVAGGRLYLAWQGCTRNDYDVFLSGFDGQSWSEPVRLSKGDGNDWDPTIAAGPDGNVWVAWSAYREGDYELHVAKCVNGKADAPLRLGEREAYELHPFLTVDPQGRPWVTYDRVVIPNHGSSWPINSPKGAKLLSYGPVIRCLDGDRALSPPALPAMPKGFDCPHGSFPVVAVDSAGGVVLALRAQFLLRAGSMDYWWHHVLLTRCTGGNWSDWEVVPAGNGDTDRPMLFTGVRGVHLAYQTDYLRPHGQGLSRVPAAATTQPALGVPELARPPRKEVLAQLRTTLLPQSSGPAADLGPLARPTGVPAPWTVRIPRSAGQYRIEYRGRTLRLFWGDTHRHSNLSTCGGSLREPIQEDLWHYAHDVYQVDYMSTANHLWGSLYHGPYMWQDFKLSDMFYIPGRMAALFGQEDRYPRTGPTTGDHVWLAAARPSVVRHPEVAKSWDHLNEKGLKVIGIPHYHAGRDWNTIVIRNEVMRVTELFQAMRGSFETPGGPRVPTSGPFARKAAYVHDGLAKGCKFGFIASSDHQNGACYAVVYAPDLTRESVFQALYDRRCYAATCYGIVVDFRADGHLMGEEYAAEKAPEFNMKLRAPTAILSVEILRDSRVVQSWPGDGESFGAECRLTWTDDAPMSGATRWYYIRVILENREMAWSSPIWITGK